MLTEWASLWLPIVVSAAAVWIVSAIMWMVMPHHRNDQVRLPDEKAFMDFVRSQGIPPGNYAFPDCKTAAARNAPEVKEALDKGPMGTLSVWKPPMKMGPKMVATFVVLLIVSAIIGYLAALTIDPKPAAMRVLRVVGTAGILAYTFGGVCNMIWFGAYTRTIIASIVDGIVYGLVTGLVFMWLWPT
ncbi:MAG: hypothetical protein AMXMBFR58_28020 [Phycisphaerae bacterium]|nr:hypothetical protein [Phycisphaerales bacterium]MCK6477211.1 hypothetical protein [Phycisphaerales bacterium]